MQSIQWKWIRNLCLHAMAAAIRLSYTLYFSSLRIIKVKNRYYPWLLPPDQNVIYVFWHSKTFALLPCCRNLEIGVLTLLDWKNLIYNRLCQLYGYQTVPVTSEPRATVRLRNILESGKSIGIAVDGPNGPVGYIKPGVLFLSKATGKSIVAMNVRVARSFRIGSRWDKFEIPLPFTEAVITLSEPLQVTETNVKEIEEKILSHLKDI